MSQGSAVYFNFKLNLERGASNSGVNGKVIALPTPNLNKKITDFMN